MTSQALILIIGMSIVTFLPRFLPILFLSKKEISPSLSRWMSYIPVSVFAALVASDVFFVDGAFAMQPLQNVKLLPSIFVIIVALKTKSLLWSMITGIISITLLSAIL
ncbi:MAG: AzlD domain-containing protein [Alkalibacterium sp.]|uniref:Branched-chain amino acid transport protein n=1 Tax=Alkalibacterium gilvum TaxID=1130080 RepID=A0A1H6UBF2_9LACT|nr:MULTISPECIES: AzlD domain-containing protein [Alkalibacterium]MDN6193697.1 AzlD domain-containing protein [Alkalibacterium sp.]MDN6292994.1 AzlD domain-containing protein [Alkalibacterium sp.]MDN6295222.1 AzlD domain-containing protein [Alkalibacterium sp.]MDN6327233.1 AzlD domain-containing protein [Alkalibacterium sp.]MDN6385547.1 AzlD domain-containing protein [Alkalibacterium sp.]